MGMLIETMNLYKYQDVSRVIFNLLVSDETHETNPRTPLEKAFLSEYLNSEFIPYDVYINSLKKLLPIDERIQELSKVVETQYNGDPDQIDFPPTAYEARILFALDGYYDDLADLKNLNLALGRVSLIVNETIKQIEVK